VFAFIDTCDPINTTGMSHLKLCEVFRILGIDDTRDVKETDYPG